MNRQKLEEDLIRARERLIFRAIELSFTGPTITDEEYKKAQNAFNIAAYDLADYLIREQEKRLNDEL